MVDKLWYDWQNAHPANFWSFDGGSIAWIHNFVPDPTFPNGAPPLVTVRSLFPITFPLDEPSCSSRRRPRQTVS